MKITKILSYKSLITFISNLNPPLLQNFKTDKNNIILTIILKFIAAGCCIIFFYFFYVYLLINLVTQKILLLLNNNNKILLVTPLGAPDIVNVVIQKRLEELNTGGPYKVIWWNSLSSDVDVVSTSNSSFLLQAFGLVVVAAMPLFLIHHQKIMLLTSSKPKVNLPHLDFEIMGTKFCLKTHLNGISVEFSTFSSMIENFQVLFLMNLGLFILVFSILLYFFYIQLITRSNCFIPIKTLTLFDSNLLSGHIVLHLFSKIIYILRNNVIYSLYIAPLLLFTAFYMLETLIVKLQSFIPATLAQIWVYEFF